MKEESHSWSQNNISCQKHEVAKPVKGIAEYDALGELNEAAEVNLDNVVKQHWCQEGPVYAVVSIHYIQDPKGVQQDELIPNHCLYEGRVVYPQNRLEWHREQQDEEYGEDREALVERVPREDLVKREGVTNEGEEAASDIKDEAPEDGNVRPFYVIVDDFYCEDKVGTKASVERGSLPGERVDLEHTEKGNKTNQRRRAVHS